MSDAHPAIPVPLVGATTDPDGRTVLLRPKFTSRRLQWLQRMMWKPYFRVKLDEVGAFVWARVDGRTSAGEIFEAVRAHFGEAAEPVEVRTGAFLNQLAEGRFVRWERPDGMIEG